MEAQNAALRRRNSTYRRRTNTYAKSKDGLQRTLDIQWVFHNFIKIHYTTKRVPAVEIGVLEEQLSWLEIFSIKCL